MTRRAPLLSVVVGLFWLLAAAAPTLAHAELVRSNPKADSTVSDVTRVALVFSEDLDAAKSSFKLIAPDGSTVGSGAVTDNRRMELDGLSLDPGQYTVKWTSAATDGHIERGEFSFTVEASASPEASDPGSAEPATQSPEPTPSPAGTPAPTASPGGTNEPPLATPTAAPAASATPAVTDSPVPTAAAAASDAAIPTASASPNSSNASSSGTDVVLPIVAAIVILGIVGALVLRRSRAA